jgi:hypothetical protein
MMGIYPDSTHSYLAARRQIISSVAHGKTVYNQRISVLTDVQLIRKMLLGKALNSFIRFYTEIATGYYLFLVVSTSLFPGQS